MAWFIRILFSAIAAGVATISFLYAMYAAYTFYGKEIAQFPSSEVGLEYGVILAIYGGLAAMVIFIILFILFMTFYKRLNILGLLLGAGFGLWVTYLVQFFLAWTQLVGEDNAWIYEYLYISPFIFMLVGLFVIKHDTKWFSLAGTVAGAAGGFVISYVAVIAYPWVENTMLTNRYRDEIEITVLWFGVLLFALIGNAAGVKYRRKLYGHNARQESALE